MVGRPLAVCALAAEAGTLRGARAEALVVGPGLGQLAGADGKPDPVRLDRTLAAARPSVIVSWGLAGALDADLTVGSARLPQSVVGQDGRRFACAPELLGPHFSSDDCSVATVAAPVHSAAERSALARESGAQLVDMESAWLAAAAERLEVPFACVRAVSDGPSEIVPDWIGNTMSPDGSLRIGALMVNLARHPLDVPALLRLQRGYNAARRSLRTVGDLLEFSENAF